MCDVQCEISSTLKASPWGGEGELPVRAREGAPWRVPSVCEAERGLHSIADFTKIRGDNNDKR